MSNNFSFPIIKLPSKCGALKATTILLITGWLLRAAYKNICKPNELIKGISECLVAARRGLKLHTRLEIN